ncbi:MAG: SRPBCC family protein [Solirubrobacteraceae bacterium]|nr:SRPBCC family protein [Solirubrobacteraceae bacterium]
MARFHATVPSARSTDDTFRYLADFGNLAEWDPSTLRSRRLDREPLGVGNRFDVTMRLGGREVQLDYATVEFDAGRRRVVLVGRNGGTTSIDRMTVADDATVTYDATVEFTGPLRLADPFFGLYFQYIGKKAARRMREVLAA